MAGGGTGSRNWAFFLAGALTPLTVLFLTVFCGRTFLDGALLFCDLTGVLTTGLFGTATTTCRDALAAPTPIDDASLGVTDRPGQENARTPVQLLRAAVQPKRRPRWSPLGPRCEVQSKMLKRVTLSPHGTMSANWTSEGMEIFSGLAPTDQARLVNTASSPDGRRRLDELVGDADAAEDVMSRLVVAIEKHGLDGTRDALLV